MTRGRRKVVGVNCYTDEAPQSVEVFRVPEALAPQKAKLERLRARRDSPRVKMALQRLRKAIEADENTLPPLPTRMRTSSTFRASPATTWWWCRECSKNCFRPRNIDDGSVRPVRGWRVNEVHHRTN